MNKEHQYLLSTEWTGNTGNGTIGYKGYERSYTISANDKPSIYGSSDENFRGDKNKYNPEELLVASLSSCHMLWYLHLCSEAGVIVVNYVDEAHGTMIETSTGGGRFNEVVLHPHVTVQSAEMIDKARALHDKAHEVCFIANSVNFPVFHQPEIHVYI